MTQTEQIIAAWQAALADSPEERIAGKALVAELRRLAEELAQARADRDVLAAELRAWRDAEHLRIDEPHEEFMTRAWARSKTNESQALNRAN